MNEGSALPIREWKESLEKLEALLIDIAKDLELPDVIPSIIKRLRSASELLSGDRFEVLIVKSEGGMAFITVGTDEMRRHIAKSSSESRTATHVRDFYITHAGPYGIKCTCEDALITSSKADNTILNLARTLEIDLSDARSLPIASRHILCKHTLALVSLFTALNILDLEDPRLIHTLKLGVIALALREGLLAPHTKGAGSTAEIVNELLRS